MNVSVCIPTFNQSQYLRQSVLSAINQTVKPTEIIVSDDCSTDNTRQVLDELQKDYPALKIIQQPRNLGLNANVNACLRAATSEFIVRIDSDDFLANTFIEKLGGLLQKTPDAGYAHATVQEIDIDGNFLKLRQLARASGYQTGDEAFKASAKGFRVAANLLIFRREALEKVNFITSSINYAEDYFLVASLDEAGFGNIYLKETLGYCRIWIDKAFQRPKRKLAEIVGFRTVFREVLEPGFKKRKWKTRMLALTQEEFACEQAQCLSLSVYTASEKLALFKQLEKLSISAKARLYRKLYLNGFGSTLRIYENTKASVRRFAKSIIVGFMR